MRLRQWLPAGISAVAACLCALAAYGFWQQGAPAGSGGWTDAAAYVGQLQTEVVEHEAMLYRQLVRPDAGLNAALDRRERSLEAGAAWLDRTGEAAAGKAVRAYLAAAAATRGAEAARSGEALSRTGEALARAGESLAGPVHRAAGDGLAALLNAQVAQRSREAAAVAGVAEGHRQTAELLLALSLVLALLAVGAAVWWRAEAPGPAGEADDQTGLPPEALDRAARAAERLVALGAEAAEAGRRPAASAGVVAAGLGEIAGVTGAHADELGRMVISAAQLQQAVARVAAEMQAQGSGIGQARTQAEPLAGGAASLTARFGAVHAQADGVLRLARSSAANAEQVARPVAELLARSSDATALLAALTERTQHIEGIVAAIKGIAAQTNMLALNAAIEAARAGDRGRGFAVVADAVRALAQKAQQHAREIELRVAGISDTARQGAEAVGRQRALASAAADAMQGARSGLAQLAAAADENASASLSVQQSASALEAACRQIGETLAQPSATLPPSLDTWLLELKAVAGRMAFGASETAIAVGEARREAGALQAEADAAAGHTGAQVQEAERIATELHALAAPDGT